MNIEELLEQYRDNDYYNLSKVENITKLCEEIERLNNIINDIRKDIEIIEQIDSIDIIKMNLRNIVFKVKEIDNNVK